MVWMRWAGLVEAAGTVSLKVSGCFQGWGGLALYADWLRQIGVPVTSTKKEIRVSERTARLDEIGRVTIYGPEPNSRLPT